MHKQISSPIFHRKLNRGNSRHVCLDQYLTVSSHGLSVAENRLCVRATVENSTVLKLIWEDTMLRVTDVVWDQGNKTILCRAIYLFTSQTTFLGKTSDIIFFCLNICRGLDMVYCYPDLCSAWMLSQTQMNRFQCRFIVCLFCGVPVAETRAALVSWNTVEPNTHQSHALHLITGLS